VILLPYSVHFSRIASAAIRAEKLGFDSIWISDHLQRNKWKTLECWTTISALAARTTKIRIGSLATCNSFRSPALLARIVATASQISNGRIDVALGLGYDDKEHAANGYSFPKFGQRVEQLSESLQILNLLWKGSEVNFNGKHYTLKGAVSKPKPKSLKLWVAGRNQRILSAASKYAYGINVLPYSGVLENRRISTLQELKEISSAIDKESVGRTHFGKSMYCGDGGVVLGKSVSEYRRRLKNLSKKEGLTTANYEEKINNLSIIHGTIDHCKDTVSAISSLGFEELMMVFPGWQVGDYLDMEHFAREFIDS
jgi:alkanesulfonate monooxygenase SsuD/methylene tetrahydromethanopterin reductase-like flavin-dependent oxidoreductase (luciferase family)